MGRSFKLVSLILFHIRGGLIRIMIFVALPFVLKPDHNRSLVQKCHMAKLTSVHFLKGITVVQICFNNYLLIVIFAVKK
jgi:hypothetical protein